MTVVEFHQTMLNLIDERMGEDGRTSEQAKELAALAAACQAFEAVMFPLET